MSCEIYRMEFPNIQYDSVESIYREGDWTPIGRTKNIEGVF